MPSKKRQNQFKLRNCTMAQQERKSGKVVGVNGNMITVEFGERVIQNEVAYVRVDENTRLKSEVVRVRGNVADLQVYEDTSAVVVGCPVDFTGEQLSVVLGPGLLGRVFDGL